MIWKITHSNKPPTDIWILFYDPIWNEVYIGMYHGGTIIDGILYNEYYTIKDHNTYETQREPKYWAAIPDLPK